ncbi:MAG: hypothetical protein ABI416_05410 [Ginsengibacter sp.]
MDTKIISFKNIVSATMPAFIFRNMNICFFIFCLVQILCTGNLYGQSEVAPWGNITGIRVGGELVGFESSLNVIDKDWSRIKATGKERQKPEYVRDGNQQKVTTKIDRVNFTEIVEDVKVGTVKVTVQLSTDSAMKMEGLFFGIALPLKDYSLVVTRANKNTATKTVLSMVNEDIRYSVKKIQFKSPLRNLAFVFEEDTKIIIKKNADAAGKTIQVYFPILEGDVVNAATAEKKFTIIASGSIDRSPITFKLDTLKTGHPFDGFGGNFRLQNPKTDPQVIDYCLQNLRVAWGRVEFPWRFWQPVKNDDPVMQAKEGKLNPGVQQSMDMVVRLNKMGIPVILSGWFPPQWAVAGKLNFRPGADGVWGNQLDTACMKEIYKSIADYILYLKDNYGVEIALFSFNESDLGINVRQSSQEHAALIKGLGAYFKSKGLSTKMLLGDNSDATTYQFIYPAMHDPDAIPYIGAVSFHSWRGWETELLEKWKTAADQLRVPLLVGEGSIDAAAWNYPAIFEEQTYVLQEISLYIRLLSVCQPLSILQWQLTSDYSPLAGGGIFGNDEPLRPTQRFWNFKQLASTPKGLFAMPVTTNGHNVTSAALGDNAKGIYTVHIVNNGPGRNATLTGLPTRIKRMYIYTTDKTHAVAKSPAIRVSNGVMRFHVDPQSYTTVMSEDVIAD